MILKGSSRGGAIDLAMHLGNEIDNEQVRVLEVRGATSTNLYDAFREWQTISECSRATKPFYSMSISPDPQQRDWTEDEWSKALDKIEDKLALTGQPRAIVEHRKEGEDGRIRMHRHVVWSRIKVEDHKLRAISDSHDRYKLRAVSKELAKDFKLELRRGRKHAFDHAKSHGKNRDAETSEQRKATITKLWQKHKNARAFTIALSNAGYVIAQGDRRRIVVLDSDGQVHALARQIDGVNTKAVSERLGSSESYPTVEAAKEEQRIRTARLEREERQQRKRVDLTKEQRLMRKLQRMAKRADQLHRQRQEKLKAQIDQIKIQNTKELGWMQKRFRAETAKIIRKRKLAEPKGLTKQILTLVGYDRLLRWKHIQQDQERQRAITRQQSYMKQAQAEHLERIADKQDLIEKQERREAKSLEKLSKKLAISVQRAKQQQEELQQLKSLKQSENEKIRFSRG